MKHLLSQSTILISACLAVSCSYSGEESLIREVTFRAGFDQKATKTVIVEEEGNKYHIYWQNGDRLSIFDDNLKECMFVAKTPGGEDSPTTDLSGSGVFNSEDFSGKTNLWGETKTYYAIYPRNQQGAVTADGIYTVPQNIGLLQNQLASENNFPFNANSPSTRLSGVYVAKSSNGMFEFKNMTSYIKFTITQSDIIKICFNNNSTVSPKIGGNFSIDYSGDTPVIDKTNATWNQVTLCNDKNYSTPIPPGTYYLVILPSDFTEERPDGAYFKMLLYTEESGKNTVAQRVDYTKPIDITPGMILDLGTITHD